MRNQEGDEICDRCGKVTMEAEHSAVSEKAYRRVAGADAVYDPESTCSDCTTLEEGLGEALTATADDLRHLAGAHVENLRALGSNELADHIEGLAKNALAVAQEFNTRDHV